MTRRTGPGSVVGRLAGVALAALVVAALLYAWSVQTEAGQRIDQAAVTQHRYDRTRDVDVHLFSAALLVGAVGLAPAAAVVGWRRPTALGACAVGVVGSVASAQVLRRTVLDRPNLLGDDALNGPSFPSGHATAAMALTLAVVALWPRVGSRWVLAVASAVGAVSVVVPVHRPSDVVAGYLLALGWMAATLAMTGDRASLAPAAPPKGRGHEVAVVVGVWVTLVVVAELCARRAALDLRDLGAALPVALAVVVLAAEGVLRVWRWALLPLRSGSVDGG